MTDSQKIRVLANEWMAKADQTLIAARKLLHADLPGDSASRSYYAMFYAVSALLLTRGLGTSKHKGALTLFSREFVRQGLISKELALDLNAAFRTRMDADYDVTRSVDQTAAQRQLEAAERFVAGVRPFLARLLDELDATQTDQP